jgi:dolichyl-phosphate-mannose--protein O-mannosyl transferase
MYWYHTQLKAEHSYQSKPAQWALNLRPVWLYVDYKDETIANIYTLGNPIFMWIGLSSIIFLILEFIKKKSLNIGVVLLGYFGFFIPWIFSPRIMFHYHYLASATFLAIAIGYMISQIKNTRLGLFGAILFLVSLVISFIYFFPLWTAVHVPKNLSDSYFWISSWK